MPRYAAFLRGMNVGGHRITNEDLRERFTAIGLREVKTFRASGNVIFLSDAQPDAELQARVEAGLAASLGYGVPTFIRSAEEVKAIAAHAPFTKGQLASFAGRRQVVLLAEAPARKATQAVLALADERDALAFAERELHWLPSGSVLDSPLDWKAIEQLIGTTTMRTIGTVEQIAAKYMDA
jgi:uncharacterized protein (DUF1697 family)